MINKVALDLMKCFPNSFINQNGEFIAHLEANEYFKLLNCENELEVKCKVLEWLSRGAYKTQPFHSNKKNEQFNKFMLNGINKFLETKFCVTDIGVIYQELGNQVNRKLTIKFVDSDYDISILKGE